MEAVLTPARTKALERNFTLMFFINAFSNLKVINIVWSIFFVHRGLSLSQVFYLSIIYAIASLIFEVPSSYMADVWGRKKTLIASTIVYCTYWIVFINAHSFALFSFGIFLYAVANAFRTGTDDAVIYDTNRELQHATTSLKRLGNYYSAQHVFKIVAPIVGVLIAGNLSDHQFVILLCLDLIASSGALIAALLLVEPKHSMDLEKQEAGIIMDAVNLLRNNRFLSTAMFNRTFLFIATFILWVYHQQFFIERGVSLLVLGISASIFHASGYLLSSHIQHILPSWSVARRLNLFNDAIMVFGSLMVVCLFIFPSPYLLLLLMMLFFKAETLRWPLFSEYFNKQSFSFNRATTMSLYNLLKSIFDVPLLFTAAWLVGLHDTYPFFLAFAVSLLTIVFFRVKEYHTSDTSI